MLSIPHFQRTARTILTAQESKDGIFDNPIVLWATLGIIVIGIIYVFGNKKGRDTVTT